MKSSKIIIFLGVVVILLAGLWIIGRPDPDTVVSVPPPSPSPAVLQTITIIDYSNGQKSTHIREPEASQSAFALLQSISAEQSLDLKFKQYPFGVLIESIGDVINTKDKAWIYFVNSRSPEVGADQYQVQPGDTIEWKYIKPE